MKIKPPQRILLSRTDGIGDVVLTLPMAGALKRHFPDCTVAFLGRAYTQPVVGACEHIDEFINWDDLQALPSADRAEQLAAARFDAVIHVFPRREIASTARVARIPLRVGTSRRWFHLHTCNRLTHFSRKSSSLHEAQLNLRLLEPLGLRRFSLKEIPDLFGLTRLEPLAEEFARMLEPERTHLILHPKSHGSGKEWGVDNWAQLIAALSPRFQIFITGSEAEGALVRPALVRPFPQVHDLTGRLPLGQLISFVAAADALVACSTGPLHLAAALGTFALGLYPSRRPIHPGRWAPLGRKTAVIEDGVTERYAGNLAISVERAIKALTALIP